MNFPIISRAYKSGANLTVTGWSGRGAIIEIFLTDVGEGTAAPGDNQLDLSKDYDADQTYMATFVQGSTFDGDTGISNCLDDDNNTDSTNRFKITFTIPPSIPFW